MSIEKEQRSAHNASRASLTFKGADSGDEKGGPGLQNSKRKTTASDISVTVLSTLKEVSQAAGGIEYVGIAAAIALEIVNAAQGAKDNKDSFNRLASDACTLAMNIVAVCKDLSPEEEGICSLLEQHLQTFTETLEQIREYAKKRANKVYWKRFISSRSDLDRIKEFRERLTQAIGLFGVSEPYITKSPPNILTRIPPSESQVQSHITIRESIARMATRQESFHDELKEIIPRQSSPEPLSPTETVVEEVPFPTSAKCTNPFRSGSMPAPSPAQSSFDNVFKGLLASSNITGSITINNVSGNSHIVTNNNSCVRKNVRNVYNTTTVNSGNTYVRVKAPRQRRYH
ncbi:hypothetical protein AAF712_011581 [Marasmius tenuissimus]|uniref:Uncharacterized protein n=1 Tax=Marasmius tenuissimus TaxID=585030 RepID=A0ABR2ZJQ1_9AGAR